MSRDEDAPPRPVAPMDLARESTRRSFERIQMALAHRVTLMGGEPTEGTRLQGALIALTVQHTTLLQLCIARGVLDLETYQVALAENAAQAEAQYAGAAERPQ